MPPLLRERKKYGAGSGFDLSPPLPVFLYAKLKNYAFDIPPATGRKVMERRHRHTLKN
jgi:hypothetical protein